MKFIRVLCIAFILQMMAMQAFAQLPSFEQVRAGYVSSEARLLDRHGNPLSDLRLDFNIRRLAWIPLTDLSPAMREALLAAEDKRFFEHPGVDWRAFIGAAWQNLWSHTRRGGSTLTMQLAGLLEPELRLPSKGRRSYSQKWDQSLAAIELEKHWSKAQILEAYLNLAPLRGDLQGLAAGSAFLFGLDTQALTRKEATILAALLRGPNAAPQTVARRACALANTLGDDKICPEIKQIAQERLDTPRSAPLYALAPHLARQLLHQPGQVLTTSLDAGMQDEVLNIVRHTGAPDTAVLVLDNPSNEALVWVGAPTGSMPDGVTIRRRLPQWWWPHAATLALDSHYVTAATPLTDPTTVVADTQPPDMASLRTALAQHRAGPMRGLLRKVPAAALSERLLLLGLEPPLVLDTPNVSSEVTLSQVAAAWRALATGTYGPPHVQRNTPVTKKILSAAASFIVLDSLAAIASDNWSAQWLAESPDMRQTLLVGSSGDLTIAVFVSTGNEHASRLAQQIWRQTLEAVQLEPARAPEPPGNLVPNIVIFDSFAEPSRQEWFFRTDEMLGEGYIRF